MPVVGKDQGWDGDAYEFYTFMFFNIYSFTLCVCAHTLSQKTASRSLFCSFSLQDLGFKLDCGLGSKWLNPLSHFTGPYTVDPDEFSNSFFHKVAWRESACPPACLPVCLSACFILPVFTSSLPPSFPLATTPLPPV